MESNMSTTIERKYRKQVNSHGWMRKLQTWTWAESTPHFVGYCPFFWFTWLCLLLIPITLVLKTVAFAFRLVFSAIPATFWITRPLPERLLEFYKDVRRFGINEVRTWNSYRSVFKWIDITPDWENCILAIIAKQEKKAEKEAVREPKRAKFANRMARYSGYIVKPILAAVAIFILYLALPKLWKGMTWLWTLILSVTWDDFLFMAKAAGFAAIIVAILYVLVYLLVRFIEGIRGCPKCPEKITLTYKAGLALSSGVDFLLETVAALYTSECPLIEWGDHSAPIERREVS